MKYSVADLVMSKTFLVSKPHAKAKPIITVLQGVSYSQKFCSKHGFFNLANSKTSQFMLVSVM